ncbi:F/Y rich C-terminus-domain-containing protein [Lentinula aff. detonsa]|uniref:F/Y rich C-terminus-domain-containing protein n=1 Tax=Lentinula aff. detonsa TaxID=2804958 RepID=A0AA38NQ07_9AGAR|nr:F/Y rich C-terminus-domain-containing protein [Lentinula aff. detonsa]
MSSHHSSNLSSNPQERIPFIQNASVNNGVPDSSTAILNKTPDPQIGEKRRESAEEEHSDTHNNNQKSTKRPRVIENLRNANGGPTKNNVDVDCTQNDTIDPILDPALQSESQPRPTTSTSSSLASNPYAIYLTNPRSGSGTAPAYPAFANPYYFLTIPPATVPIPSYSPHLHPGIPFMPPIYPYTPPVTILDPRLQAAVPSASVAKTRPEFTQSPVQSQTVTSGSPASANSGGDQNATSLQHSISSFSKPRRLKSHAVVSKNHSIPTIPRDKYGQPMLPLNVGIMTVVRLGNVCFRDHFHSERYIFPVGYTVTRRYLSTLDPSAEVVYHCTILDGGDGPKFQIVPSDEPDKPIIASTATGAWSSIVRKANEIRKRQHSNSVSGPDFYGLGQNTIRHLIQQLSGAERLAKRGTRKNEDESENEDGKGGDRSKRRRCNGIYVWQNYIEGGSLGGRHAAVIPALPDQYGSTQSPSGSAGNHEHSIESGSASGRSEGINRGSHTPYTAQDPGAKANSTIATSTSVDPNDSSRSVTRSSGLSYYPSHVLAEAELQMQPQGYYYPPQPNPGPSPSYYPVHYPPQPIDYTQHQHFQAQQHTTGHPQFPLHDSAHVQATLASLLHSLARAHSEDDPAEFDSSASSSAATLIVPMNGGQQPGRDDNVEGEGEGKEKTHRDDEEDIHDEVQASPEVPREAELSHSLLNDQDSERERALDEGHLQEKDGNERGKT